ncbi:copper homeostasis CutC domain-containing protein [Gautieria morchelliformis]|nr:copper homeostasis CutC domain-containing protein [Gautieria morchelliformis]
MIRPRTGDFVYSDLELDIMLEDIRSFKQENVTGVVFGVLSTDGRVDIMKTRMLVQAAHPLQVCFHRGFDMTKNPVEALNDVASIGGITRILTSGHGKYAPENLATLSSMASLALTFRPPITILAGSGINVNTAHAIARCDWWKRFKEVHLSAGQWIDGHMQFRKEGMGMGGGGASDWGIWRTDSDIVREVRQIMEDSLQL